MVIDLITEQRFARYMLATGHNKKRALDLYIWNIRISEAFYPLLNVIEVSLRNIISAQLTSIYGGEWWENEDFLNQIRKGRRVVKRAQENLQKYGNMSSGKLVAELNFGFWCNMLLPYHEDIFWRNLREILPHLPHTIAYSTLFERNKKICDLRNRIFHHEPIFNRNISKDYSDIVEAIGWISPEKADWIKPHCRVMKILREKP